MILLITACALTSCGSSRYDPDLATRPYPRTMHQPASVDIQVFRHGTQFEVVNSTATSYHDFDLWVNQRYVRHVEALPAGGTIRLSLWDFRDERGETIDAGGFFRAFEPTPVRMVQLQTSEADPLIGLVTIRSEKPDEIRR